METDSTSNPTLPEGYAIRSAKEEDIGVVSALLFPFVQERKLLRRTQAETQALLVTGFVAIRGTEIVGFSAVEIYSKKLAEIQCLIVAPAHQGRGLGGALVRHCINLAKQRNVMEIMAISSSESFLQELGFDYSLPDQKRALFCQLRSRESVYRELDDADE